ncbi:MAG: YHS domain-containing protein, partial [Polyangiaceae bacterium]
SRLATDARRLAGQASPPAPAPAAAAGGDLYASLGCPGCHADHRIAPPLDDLSGATVALDDGTTVTADDAYLRRSILDPAGQLVAGYPASMPSYAELSEAQVAGLVREVAGMKSSAGAPAAAPARFTKPGPAGATARDSVKTATDPVCGMHVLVELETPRQSYQGREVYFCSQRCRDSFLADPARYAGSPR